MLAAKAVSLAACLAVLLPLVTACAPDDGGSPTASPSTTATVSPTPTSSTPLITIGSPAAGAIVATPVTASGSANTFEAALTVDAVAESGETLCVRNIMATAGMGVVGTWQTTLAFPPPATEMPVTLRAYEFSAKDGSIVNLVERTITVSTQRPAIFITSPACGAVLAPGRTLTVTGRALVPEAQFSIELRNDSGVAVLEQAVMAARGDEESDWSAALALPMDLATGMYDLVAFDNSLKDGSIVHEYSLQILIRS